MKAEIDENSLESSLFAKYKCNVDNVYFHYRYDIDGTVGLTHRTSTKEKVRCRLKFDMSNVIETHLQSTFHEGKRRRNLLKELKKF
jgi:hypothetical protein